MKSPSPHPTDELLIACLDGETADDAAVTAHCEQCETCRERLFSYQAVDRLLDTSAPDTMPHSVWSDVQARLVAESRPFFTPALTAGAAAALCIGMFLGLTVGRAPHTELATETSIWSAVGASFASQQNESWPALYTNTDLNEGE